MENFKNASMLKPVNTFAKEGEAGYDPFSRRWTRSQNYYQSQPKAEEKEATDGVNAEGKYGTSIELLFLIFFLILAFREGC
jgi:RNA polymerase-associated protein RTF1